MESDCELIQRYQFLGGFANICGDLKEMVMFAGEIRFQRSGGSVRGVLS